MKDVKLKILKTVYISWLDLGRKMQIKIISKQQSVVVQHLHFWYKTDGVSSSLCDVKTQQYLNTVLIFCWWAPSLPVQYYFCLSGYFSISVIMTVNVSVHSAAPVQAVCCYVWRRGELMCQHFFDARPVSLQRVFGWLNTSTGLSAGWRDGPLQDSMEPLLHHLWALVGG